VGLRARILGRFSGQGDAHPLHLPDLTLWYDWHHRRDTLPDRWKKLPLPDIARAMGAPVRCTIQPWRVETPGIEISTTELGRHQISHRLRTISNDPV
jgi:hypothetical protein